MFPDAFVQMCILSPQMTVVMVIPSIPTFYSHSFTLSCSHHGIGPWAIFCCPHSPPEPQGMRCGQPFGPWHSSPPPGGGCLAHSAISRSSDRPKSSGRWARPCPAGLPPSLPSCPPVPGRHPRFPVLPLRQPSSHLRSHTEMERVKVAAQLAPPAPSRCP
ncbi:hypothetical protein XENOCAPTIV_002406 [Xenoophorus captivus]|uniref:Uncharacterized protein n=1 Tax=Xenoophorus captivus TaxID=1517983 RepID=A0ABV0QL70_9TELE